MSALPPKADIHCWPIGHRKAEKSGHQKVTEKTLFRR